MIRPPPRQAEEGLDQSTYVRKMGRKLAFIEN